MGRRVDYVESFARTMLQKESQVSQERTQAVQLASQAVQQASQNRAMRRDMVYARMNGMQQVANMFAKNAQVQMQREQMLTDRTKTLADIEMTKAKMRLEDEMMGLQRDKLHMESVIGVRRLWSDIQANRSTEAYNKAIAKQASVRATTEMMDALPKMMDYALKAQAEASEQLSRSNAGVAAQFGMHYRPENKEEGQAAGFVAGPNSLAATIYDAGFADTSLSLEQFSGNMVGRLGDTYAKRIEQLRYARRQQEIQRTGNKSIPLPSIDSIPAPKRQELLRDSITDTMSDYAAMGAVGAATGQTREKLMNMYSATKEIAAGRPISVEMARALGLRVPPGHEGDEVQISLGQREINGLLLNIASHVTLDSKGNIKGAVGSPSQQVNDYWNNSLLTLSTAIAGTPEFFDRRITETEKYNSAGEGIQAFGAAAVIGTTYIRNMLLNGDATLGWDTNLSKMNVGLQTVETAQATRDGIFAAVEDTAAAMGALLRGETPESQAGAVEGSGNGEPASNPETTAPVITPAQSLEAMINLMKTGPTINPQNKVSAEDAKKEDDRRRHNEALKFSNYGM